MQQRTVNPVDTIYAATPDYVHALEISAPEKFLFVSGTMGLEPTGRAPQGAPAQLNLIWANLRRILREANMTPDNIIRVTSYLTSADLAKANQEARLEALGKRRVPTTAIVVETLDPDWLIEIEIIAAA